MEAKGTAALALMAFVKSKFGEQRFNEWLAALSPQAKAVYSAPVLSSSWFPIKEILSEPTKVICDMFYGGQVTGAFECGKFSADHALKGIYRMFVQLGSPQFIIDRATVVLPTYYRPSKLEITGKSKNGVVLRITEFPESDKYIENRIAGWVEGALVICGCKNLQVKITASKAAGQPYTEISSSWA